MNVNRLAADCLVPEEEGKRTRAPFLVCLGPPASRTYRSLAKSVRSYSRPLPGRATRRACRFSPGARPVRRPVPRGPTSRHARARSRPRRGTPETGPSCSGCASSGSRAAGRPDARGGSPTPSCDPPAPPDRPAGFARWMDGRSVGRRARGSPGRQGPWTCHPVAHGGPAACCAWSPACDVSLPPRPTLCRADWATPEPTPVVRPAEHGCVTPTRSVAPRTDRGLADSVRRACRRVRPRGQSSRSANAPSRSSAARAPQWVLPAQARESREVGVA